MWSISNGIANTGCASISNGIANPGCASISSINLKIIIIIIFNFKEK